MGRRRGRRGAERTQTKGRVAHVVEMFGLEALVRPDDADPDAPLVRFDDSADQTQPDAGPLAVGVESLEEIKHLFLIGRGNAAAVVGNVIDGPSVVATRTNADFGFVCGRVMGSSRGCELRSVEKISRAS